MILTEQEKELLLSKNHLNVKFIDIPVEIKEDMLENGGYVIDGMRHASYRNLDILNMLCGCGLKFNENDFVQCPVCANENFRKQKVNLDEIKDILQTNKDMSSLKLKKKNFDSSYGFIKMSDTEYQVIREKKSYKYNWLTDDFEIITTDNKTIVGTLIKEGDLFYLLSGRTKQHALSFAVKLKGESLKNFNQIYNELYPNRLIKVDNEINGEIFVEMALFEKVRITTEYFGERLSLYLGKYELSYLNKISRNMKINHIISENKFSVRKMLETFNQEGILKFPILNEDIQNIYKATGFSKGLLKYLKNSVPKKYSSYYLNNRIQLIEKLYYGYRLSQENIIALIGVLMKDNVYNISDYHTDNFFQIIGNNHEFKHLINYLTKESEKQMLNPREMLVLYKDYINSSNQLEVPFTKYPKNLSKVHDIRMKDFEAVKDKKSKELFIKTYKSYPLKEDKVGNYIFLEPKVPNDLTLEGQNLNHCVASYVNYVLNGQSLIYMLRQKNNPSVSYITIERRIHDNAIVQVRGKFNRNPTNEERKIVTEWAKLNKFTYTAN